MLDRIKDLERIASEFAHNGASPWVRIAGGGGSGSGNSDIHFGYVDTDGMTGATGYEPENWGEGDVVEVDTDGNGGGDPITVKNRFGETVGGFTPIFFIYMDGVPVLLIPGCSGIAPPA